MTKVSIVGVEGSGKTVLMAVLGDRYQLPDAQGLFLSPSDQETFDFAKRNLADLRGGRWPSTTNGNRRLSWMLCRRSGTDVSKVCDLSLLDYPGEAFRLSFGRHSNEELAKVGLDASEVAAFRRHVQESQLLVLVVNLSVIVNAAPDDERAWESQWLVKAMLDEAAANGRRAALVFTCADAHAALIEDVDGLAGVMARWLPQVASLHANVPAFAVAAVDRTTPSASGQPVPASDFGSQGLELFVGWLSKAVGGCAWRQTCRRAVRHLRILVAVVGLVALVALVLVEFGNDIRRVLFDRHARHASKEETVDEADGETTPTDGSEGVVRDKVGDVNPHAGALEKAIAEAAKALDAGNFVQAQMCLQKGTVEYQQGCFSGEPFTVLEPLRQRWLALYNVLQQKQIQQNLLNLQRNNPYSNSGFGL